MKILLFGKAGQIARRLKPGLSSLGELIVLGQKDVDFKNPLQLREAVNFYQPQWIVNAAAYTAVDQAETDSQNAFLINTQAVKILSEEAEKLNAWFLHYSSDYVFDGQKNQPYTESDIYLPLNVYGKTKAEADTAISETCSRSIILRSSWIYDSDGQNFPKTILQLAKEKSSLKIVADQMGTPNSAKFIAENTVEIIKRILADNHPEKFSGIYHLSCAGFDSWYGFARLVLQTAKEMKMPLLCQAENLIPVTSAEFQRPAKRPKYSCLDTRLLTERFGLVMPQWNLYTAEFMQELKTAGFL